MLPALLLTDLGAVDVLKATRRVKKPKVRVYLQKHVSIPFSSLGTKVKSVSVETTELVSVISGSTF